MRKEAADAASLLFGSRALSDWGPQSHPSRHPPTLSVTDGYRCLNGYQGLCGDKINLPRPLLDM